MRLDIFTRAMTFWLAHCCIDLRLDVFALPLKFWLVLTFWLVPRRFGLRLDVSAHVLMFQYVFGQKKKMTEKDSIFPSSKLPRVTAPFTGIRQGIWGQNRLGKWNPTFDDEDEINWWNW